jgi:V8-like Glu-specific endopeptidase
MAPGRIAVGVTNDARTGSKGHTQMRLRLLTAVVLAMTMVLPLASTTAAATPDPRRAVSSGSVPTARSVASQSYWTEARMRNARPMPVGSPNRARPRVVRNSAVSGKPGRVSGSVPSTEGAGINAGEPVGDNYEYPFPFTRRTVEIELLKVYPYRTVGKVFFRQDGGNYVCSGSSVISAPRQVVFTAGHCLNDGEGHWSTQVIFVPARRNGSNPYGKFAAKELWALSGWVQDGDLAWDQAAFNVAKNSKGQKLQSVVGALGMAWNQERIQHWDLFGYPEAPFSGERPVTCGASHAVDDDVSPTDGPYTIGVGCDMAGGSSGGPWILALGRGNYINGLVSYGYDDEPDGLYSPYFATHTNALRCKAATGNASATTC